LGRRGPAARRRKNLIILNEPAYGSERSYNGLRLALALAKTEGQELRVFLMGDSVTCARTNQKTADGYYNLERMIKGLETKKVPVGCCGTCLKARGLAPVGGSGRHVLGAGKPPAR